MRSRCWITPSLGPRRQACSTVAAVVAAGPSGSGGKRVHYPPYVVAAAHRLAQRASRLGGSVAAGAILASEAALQLLIGLKEHAQCRSDVASRMTRLDLPPPAQRGAARRSSGPPRPSHSLTLHAYDGASTCSCSYSCIPSFECGACRWGQWRCTNHLHRPALSQPAASALVSVRTPLDII